MPADNNDSTGKNPSVKPRLLVFSSCFPIASGGPEGIFVEELALGMTSDFDITVLTPRLAAESPLRERRDGLDIRRFRSGVFTDRGGIFAVMKKKPFLLPLLPIFLLTQFVALIRLVREKRIDVVHAHWIVPQGLLAVLAKTLFFPRLKVALTAHGSDLMMLKDPLSLTLKRLTLRRADAISAVGRPLAEIAEKLGAAPPVEILPMGVDETLFSPDRSDSGPRPGKSDSGPLLLFAGSLIPGKGVRELIEAMPPVLERFPGARLLLAGRGALAEELESRIAELGMTGRVTLLGAVSHAELAGLMAAADLLALPSFSEGWGQVVIEALMSGTVPVVSDIPVFASHPLRELLVPTRVGEVNSLTDGLIRALSMTPEEKADYRRKAVPAARQFGLNAMRRKYADWLRNALD